MIEEDLDFLKVVAVTPEDTATALSLKWRDFENCLLACVAKKAGVDYIVTRNVADFDRSPVTAITPAQLFDELDARGIHCEEVDF